MGEAGLIEYLLPIAIMLAAVVHIIKTGRNFIWVYVVIFIPLFGALAYFVLPVDGVPDILPMLGFTDDAAVLATAMKVMVSAIRPEHREAAKRKLAE